MWRITDFGDQAAINGMSPVDWVMHREAERNALRHINLFNIALPGWMAARKDWRGNACKDLKDFINMSGKNKEETTLA